MNGLLKSFHGIALVVMLVLIVWASLQEPLWEIPSAVIQDPWFITTLFDVYFAFFTFYAWVLYREPSTVVKVLMLPAIICLGTVAIAAYSLALLFKLPAGATAHDFFARP